MGVRHWTGGLAAIILATTAWAEPAAAISVSGAKGSPIMAGDRVCVAGHKVNLRRSPTTRGRVVKRLDLGTALMVRATVPGGPVPLGGRRDWWYQVVELDKDGVAQTKGYIYGGVLTRACLHADLDDDGEIEAATVSMNPDGIIIMRVFEPYGGSDKSLTLPTARVKGNLLRDADVEVVSASASGVPLVKIAVRTADPADPTGKTSYIAYRAEAATLPGKLSLALSHPRGGIEADAPWTTTTRFDADKLTVYLTTGSGASEMVKRYEWGGKAYIERPDG